MQENIIGNFLIEGNIGSGKSSFLNKLQNITENVVIIPEPVDIWTNYQGHNYLKLFYEDKRKWSFGFLQLALTTTAQQYFSEKDKNCIKFFERSIFSPFKIFAQQQFLSGLISKEEIDLCELVTNNTAKFLNYDIGGIIYVKTSPEIALKRVISRCREEENQLIPIKYLQSLHEQHENWLNNDKNQYPVLTLINDSDKILNKFESIQHLILQWIKNPVNLTLDPLTIIQQ